MKDENSSTWPEQDVVDEWIEKHKVSMGAFDSVPHYIALELKKNLTALRPVIQVDPLRKKMEDSIGLLSEDEKKLVQEIHEFIVSMSLGIGSAWKVHKEMRSALAYLLVTKGE